MSEEPTKKRWRWGRNRWIVLLLVILGIFGSRAFSPIQPHVQLPAEDLSQAISLGFLGELTLTNTHIAMFIGDIIILLMALSVRSAVKRAMNEGYRLPNGIAGVIEALFDYMYNMTQTTAGKWAKTIFPYFASIVLVVLVANWIELIPGVDSIGLLHHVEEGYSTQQLLPGVTAIVKPAAEGGGTMLFPLSGRFQPI